MEIQIFLTDRKFYSTIKTTSLECRSLVMLGMELLQIQGKIQLDRKMFHHKIKISGTVYVRKIKM